MSSTISPIKGTRDFYPELMYIHNWLFENIQAVSESFGYEAYDGPFLEKIDLYAAKSGEELVKEQAFCFADRGGDFITLRPELTPTLARMVAQRQQQLFMPLRWYSFGNFWRYERPQRGRTREFYQWNIDMIGVSSPEADAELIAVCAAFFKRVGLSSEIVKIRVNDRQLMDKKLSEMAIEGELKKVVFKLIDRRPKMKAAAWKKFAMEQGLSEEQVIRLSEILETPNLWEESEELSKTFQALDAMGCGEYIEYDASIIRGLDYYTGVVFEAIEVSGGRAILGGGHYDNLVGDVGGEPLSGVGFAMGDVLIKIVLEDHNLLPTYQNNDDVIMVTIFDESMLTASVKLAAELRDEGIKTAVYPEAVKLLKQFKYADRKGMRFAIVLGPDELAQNKVALKDLTSRQQELVSREELVSRLKKMLA